MSDLGLGVSGFGGESISEVWDIWGPDEDSGGAGKSADGFEAVGKAAWPSDLLFSRMVNS